MSDLLQITGDIDRILKRLETLLRSSQSKASAQDVQELVGYAYRVFDYFYDVVVNKRDEVQVDNTNDYVELAVKLHNKVRNLNAPILSIAKNLLRATAAWMFILFGEKTSKILSIIIKLLSKSGEELCRQEETKGYGLHCFNACIVLWKSSGEVPAYDQLPALELQDTKFCVFKSLQGVIMNSNITKMDVNDIKQVASFGVDIAESLDDRFQLSLVDTLFKIGHQLANGENKADAIHFLNLSVAILRKPVFQNMLHTDAVDHSVSDGHSSLVRTYLDLRVRVYLALVYIYTDIDELDKAMACIAAIEEVEKLQQRHLNESLVNTVNFSKLLVAAQQGDLEKCETAVKMLLRHSQTPFNTAIAAVKKLQQMMKEIERDRMSEYYKQLAAKYPSDPEFTAIRIAHLQATVGSLKATKDDEHHEARARDISTRIVSDHLHQLHVLRSEDFQLFRNILCDQINRYKSLGMWSYVKSWCDILISLVEHNAEEQEKVSVAFAIKVEALMHLHQSAEAVDTAQRLAAKEISLRSLTTLFKALLYSEDLSVDSILARLLTYHQKKQTAGALIQPITTEEKLQNLMMCAYISQQSDQCGQGGAFYQSIHAGKRYQLVIRLLQNWMRLFSSEQFWRHNHSPSAIDGTTLLDVLTEYISRITIHLAEDLLASLSATGVLDNTEASRVVEKLHSVQHQMKCELGSTEIDAAMMDVENVDDERRIASADDQETDCFQVLRELSLLSPSKSGSIILSFLKQDLLPYIELLVNDLNSIKVDSHFVTFDGLLGDNQLVVNTADICYRYCQLLLDVRDAASRSKEHLADVSEKHDHREGDRGRFGTNYHHPGIDILIWSKLADLSETLYKLSNPSLKRQRILCLVLSAVAFIETYDYNSRLLDNPRDESGDDLASSVFANTDVAGPSAGDSAAFNSLIDQAMQRLSQASLMQRDYIDFGSKDDEHLRSLIFTLLVSAFSRGGSVSDSERFIAANIGEINVLDEEHMRQFIEQISQSRKFSVEAVRRAMEICAQALGCRAVPSSLLGWIYRKLIELSPSRKYTCAKLEEFQTILGEREQGHFDVADVDNIIARAYNSCLMLIDLDQLSLAEQFVEHSLSLSRYSSEETKQYLPRMQETLQFIKQQQSQSNQGAVRLPPAMVEVSTGSLNEDGVSHATPEHGKVGHLNAELFTKPTD